MAAAGCWGERRGKGREDFQTELESSTVSVRLDDKQTVADVDGGGDEGADSEECGSVWLGFATACLRWILEFGAVLLCSCAAVLPCCLRSCALWKYGARIRIANSSFSILRGLSHRARRSFFSFFFENPRFADFRIQGFAPHRAAEWGRRWRHCKNFKIGLQQRWPNIVLPRKTRVLKWSFEVIGLSCCAEEALWRRAGATRERENAQRPFFPLHTPLPSQQERTRARSSSSSKRRKRSSPTNSRRVALDHDHPPPQSQLPFHRRAHFHKHHPLRTSDRLAPAKTACKRGPPPHPS